jgi:hypothetical protein
MIVGDDSPGAPAKPPDPDGPPPVASFASPATCSTPIAAPEASCANPATYSPPAAASADPIGHLPATRFANPVTYCSAPVVVPVDHASPTTFCSAPAAAPTSVQSRQDRAEDGE